MVVAKRVEIARIVLRSMTYCDAGLEADVSPVNKCGYLICP